MTPLLTHSSSSCSLAEQPLPAWRFFPLCVGLTPAPIEKAPSRKQKKGALGDQGGTGPPTRPNAENRSKRFRAEDGATQQLPAPSQAPEFSDEQITQYQDFAKFQALQRVAAAAAAAAAAQAALLAAPPKGADEEMLGATEIADAHPEDELLPELLPDR